ncbi:ANK1, partial [Symbiodinium sp. KB8]
MLMDAGADPVKPSQDNVTPLQSAKEEGHIAVTRLLLGTYTKAAESQGKKDKGKNVSINPLAIAAEEDDIVSKGSKHYLLVSRKLGCIVHWPGSQAGVEGEVKEVAFEDVEDVVMAMVNGVE